MMIVRLLFVSLVVASLSHTLARATIFEPLRARLGEGWLGQLVRCRYCASHWIAFIVVPLVGLHHTVEITPILHPRPLVTSVIETFLSAILVVMLAAVARAVLDILEGVRDALDRAAVSGPGPGTGAAPRRGVRGPERA